MKQVLFDTGVIVAALISKDPDHKSCSDFVRSIAPKQRLIPVTVVAEVAGMIEDWPDIEAGFYNSIARESFELVELQKTPKDNRHRDSRSSAFPRGASETHSGVQSIAIVINPVPGFLVGKVGFRVDQADDDASGGRGFETRCALLNRRQRRNNRTGPSGR